MERVPLEETVEQLLAVLREAFDGPKENWSYFVSNHPDAGLAATLARLDAQKASRVIGGTTIAAHVHHVVFAAEGSAAWIRGNRSKLDWKQSWSVSEVDSVQWAEMLTRLHSSYAKLHDAIRESALVNTEAMAEALGAVAHVAYHLGAVRQKALFL
jgi:hypothetical protein